MLHMTVCKSMFFMLFLFWLVITFLLSSLDEIVVCVKLLSGYVWEDDDDKLGYLSVGVDSFD